MQHIESKNILKNNTVAPKTEVRKPVIFGKLHLQTWVWQFVTSLENIELNKPLDLTRRSIFRNEIRARLVTKTQLGQRGDAVNRAKYPSVLRFSVSSTDERNLRIYLTDSAQADINLQIKLYFVELMHSHILKEKVENNTDATVSVRKFLDLYGLTSDDLDPETLTETLIKAEYRLRDMRGMASNHVVHRERGKARATGQTVIEFEI